MSITELGNAGHGIACRRRLYKWVAVALAIMSPLGGNETGPITSQRIPATTRGQRRGETGTGTRPYTVSSIDL